MLNHSVCQIVVAHGGATAYRFAPPCMHVYAMRPQRSPSRRQAKLTQCVTTRGARNAGASRAVRRAWGGSRANQRLHMREARFVEQMPRASIFRVRVARRKICCRSRTRRGEPVALRLPPLGGNCAVLQHQAHDLAAKHKFKFKLPPNIQRPPPPRGRHPRPTAPSDSLSALPPALRPGRIAAAPRRLRKSLLISFLLVFGKFG